MLARDAQDAEPFYTREVGKSTKPARDLSHLTGFPLGDPHVMQVQL